jgi:ligand-binding sensor domain-containing protein/photosystem II stability/assembly factor-like uncharacterized protein
MPMSLHLPVRSAHRARLVPFLAAACLIVTAAATAAPIAFGAAGAAPASAVAGTGPGPLDGGWRSFANGDRVNRILRDGAVVWSATEGGGLVRWDVATRAYKQYLAPQDGLLSNDVNDVAKASDGRLWLATARALSVLDPASGAVTNYTPASSPGMPAQRVTALAPTADGKLWVGFNQEWDPVTVDPKLKSPGTFRKGGLARFDPATGRWDEETHAELKRAGGLGEETPDDYVTIPSENVTTIEVGTDGIVWVGTRLNYEAEIIDCPPDSTACAADSAWVQAGGGLAAKQGSTWANWSPNTNEQSCYSSIINDLAADKDGRMWVATAGRGLLLMKQGLRKSGCKGGAQPYYVRPVRDTPGPRGNFVWSVDVAPDGRVWIGHGQGRDTGLGIGILDHNETFDDSSAANQGQAWRFDDEWTFLNLDDGPIESNQVITALDVGPGGPVLLATKDERLGDGEGLRALDTAAGSWTPLRTADNGIPSNEVTDVSWNEPKRELWVSFRHRGLARWDGSTWRSWRAFGRGRAVAKATLEVAKDKDRIAVDMPDQAAFDAAFPSLPRYVRFGDDPTLYRLTRSTLTVIGTGRYLDIAPKLQQKLPKNTTIYNVDRGPASDSAAQVCFGADGTVWATGRETIWLGESCPSTWGTECWLDGGLGRFDGTLWTVFDQQVKDGAGKTIPDQEAQSCAVDKQGKVWVGTGNPRAAEGDGIAYFDPATQRWTAWKKTQGVSFAGNGIADIDVDPVTGDIWVAHHASQFCEPPPFGGGCALIRLGGGASRWNGTKWDIWQKPAAVGMKAFGTQGELSSILVDRGAGRVWVGSWDAEPKRFHWGQGIGINAALSWCPLDCTNGAWQNKIWPNDGDLVALELDAAGHLWAGTHRSGNGITPPESGVKLFDGAQWTTLTPLNTGLPSNEITGLQRQGEAMWVGTRMRGLSVYSRALLPTPTPYVTPTETPGEATPTSLRPSATATGPTATTASGPSATPRPTSSGTDLRTIFLPVAVQRPLCVACPSPTATAPATTTPPGATARPSAPPPPASGTLPPSAVPTASASPAPSTGTATAPPSATARPAASATVTPTHGPRSWSQYTEQTLPRTRLLSVTGLADGTAFMVGEGGKAYVWNGKELAAMSIATTSNLRRVFFASEQQGFIAADDGFLYETRNGGQSWRMANVGSLVDDWWAVGLAKDGATFRGWAMGHTKGVRLLFDGTEWKSPTADDRTSTHDYTDIAMVGPNAAFATRGDASGARIMIWNGTTWMAGPTTGPLFDLDLRSATSGMAVGTRGSAWQLGSDGKWTSMSPKPAAQGEDLNAVHMLADDDVWVGGGRTLMFHWNGAAWTTVSVRVPRTPAIRSIWMAADGSDGWAVGDDGTVLRYH